MRRIMPESSTPVVPIPQGGKAGDSSTDPSALATQALWREVAHLKELLTEILDANQAGIHKEIGLVRDVIETRMDANDRAVRLLQDGADKFPALIDEKITALREVHGEKFDSVQKQFDERDVRTDTSRVSDKTAVDAALAAQEKSFSKQGETFSEATAKSEESFTKQIDQMSALHRSAIEGLQAQFNDLKDRFNRGEGRTEGVDKNVVRQQGSNSFTVAIVGVIVAVILGAAALIVNIAK